MFFCCCLQFLHLPSVCALIGERTLPRISPEFVEDFEVTGLSFMRTSEWLYSCLCMLMFILLTFQKKKKNHNNDLFCTSLASLCFISTWWLLFATDSRWGDVHTVAAPGCTQHFFFFFFQYITGNVLTDSHSVRG